MAGSGGQPPEPDPNLDRGSSTAFFDKEETKTRLALISSSTWAPHKTPTSEYHKIVNILCVSMKTKMADTQHERGGKSCPILNLYRDTLKGSNKVERLKEFMVTALENVKNEKEKDLGYLRRQMSMTHFFKKKPLTAAAPIQYNTGQDGSGSKQSEAYIDNLEEEQTAQSEEPASVAVVSTAKATSFHNLFMIFEISGASTVEKSLKISSQDSEVLTRTVELLKKLLGLLKSHEAKAAWTQRNSLFSTERNNFLDEFDNLKTKFKNLADLCDRGHDSQKAEEMSFEDFTSYLSRKAKEANSLYKSLFLKITGAEFRKEMSSLIHKLQKQISKIDSQRDAGMKKQFEITCGRSGGSWNECLADLSDWLPSDKTGNITIGHFERCKSFFLSLKIRQHEFAHAQELLDYLNIVEKKKTALKVLNENLPIMILEKGDTALVVDTEQFLQSPRMMAEFTKLMMDNMTLEDDENKEGSQAANKIKPGPEFVRKEGSGRKRRIEDDPRILEVAKSYAESAGIAAHSRRRETVGSFGFTMTTLHKVVTTKLFSQDPAKAPSISTLRRLFEAPSKARINSREYKSDIAARPGVKRNEESANGGPHEHRHEAFSLVKSAREFFSLFSHESVQISADNKAKMPVGGVPVVNRLSSLSGKFFMTGRGPNFSDHDCRTGTLIEPNGYQILTSKLESECEVLSASAEVEAGLDSDVNGIEEYLLREMNDAVIRNGAVDPGDPNQDPDTQLHPGASPTFHTHAGHSYSMDTSHFPSVPSAERFSPGTTSYTQEASSSNSISSVRLGRFSPEHSSQFISVEIAAQENNNNNTQNVQAADLSLNHGFHMTEVDRMIDDRNRALADIGKRMEEQQQKKFIVLIVVDADREIHMKVKRTTLMEKLKKAYSERVGVPITSFKFVYNGQRINDEDTAHALEMDPDAVIKVYPEQSSNKLADLMEDWNSDEDPAHQTSHPRSLNQTDGNGEISSDSNASDDDFDYEFGVAPKKRKVCVPDESSSSQNSVSSPSDNSCSSNEDCSDIDVSRPDVNSNEVSIEESFVEKGSLEEFLDNLPSAKVSDDELGRPHIKCPTSGPAYIFFKSCRTKGASISRHCNDLLNIAEALGDIFNQKPNLLLILDDGIDWGQRGLQTFYFLGKLWEKLDLDTLFVVRNAPGDSRWNIIERLWALINKKVCGLVLPQKTDDQTEDEFEDAAINQLIDEALRDVEYNGHPVFSVPVPCSKSEVMIDGKVLDNETFSQEEADTVQKIMSSKSMSRRKLSEEYPEIHSTLKHLWKHSDVRTHNIFFRKCHKLGKYSCKACQEKPPRSSNQFWEKLPAPGCGGLFFDVEEDEDNPGHYKTLLQMMFDEHSKVEPDGQFEGIKRCKESGCMYSFKTAADATRHMKIVHGAQGKAATPFGFVCRHVVNGEPCNTSFPTQAKMLKHKKEENHFVPRPRGLKK